jgi:hypothetical protein
LMPTALSMRRQFRIDWDEAQSEVLVSVNDHRRRE